MYVFGSVRRGWRRGLVDERIGFGLYQSCGNRGSVGRVYVFLRWYGCVCWWSRWGVGRGLGPGSVGVVLCVCEVRVCIFCVDGRSRYMCIVFDGYLRI